MAELIGSRREEAGAELPAVEAVASVGRDGVEGRGHPRPGQDGAGPGAVRPEVGVDVGHPVEHRRAGLQERRRDEAVGGTVHRGGEDPVER